MIEQPEVVLASEVKTGAESTVKQACTHVSGLLHDCKFSLVEKKGKEEKKKDVIQTFLVSNHRGMNRLCDQFH